MEDERSKHKGLNSGILVLETRQDTGARARACVCVCTVCSCVEEEHKVTETATGEEKRERQSRRVVELDACNTTSLMGRRFSVSKFRSAGELN